MFRRRLIAGSAFVAGLGALVGCRATLRTDLASVRQGLAFEDAMDVRVRAVLRGRIGCLPCPEENGVRPPCQPCIDMLILSESADTPEDGKVYVAGREPGLVVGRAYSFRIRLRPGYLTHMHDDSPLLWHGPPYLDLVDVR